MRCMSSCKANMHDYIHQETPAEQTVPASLTHTNFALCVHTHTHTHSETDANIVAKENKSE